MLPLPAGLHPSTESPREKHRRPDIDPQQFVELPLEAPGRGGPGEDVGPGNQNDRVEIGERRGDVVDEPRQRRLLPEIGEEPTSREPSGGELRGQVFGSRRRAAVDRDAGPSGRQPQRHGAADAVRCAGDQRRPTGERGGAWNHGVAGGHAAGFSSSCAGAGSADGGVSAAGDAPPAGTA